MLLAVSPALRVGFLADDYHLVTEIHRTGREHPGPWDTVRAAFAHQWTPRFQVLRPLTILSVQLDLQLHGTDGQRHHLTNVFLWLLCGAAFAALARRRTGGGPWWWGILFLLWGLHPAAVETLGWVVAREDLLLSLFALLALLGLHSGRGPWAWSLPVALALLAKESAVLLPPLLLWTDLLLPRDPGHRSPRSLLRRHAPPFLVLGAYLVLRRLLLGSVGTVYQGRSYLDHLQEPGAASRILEALGGGISKLVAPVNTAALERVLPWLPAWLAAALLLAPLAVLLAAWKGSFARELGLTALWAAGWAAAPLLLLGPVIQVGSDMSVSRVLALPAVGYLVLVAVLLTAARRRRPRVAGAALATMLAASAAFMLLNLRPWVQASDRAATVLADLDAMGSAGTAVLAGVDPMPPSLVVHDGAWVLSAGLYNAHEAPFHHGPRLVPWPARGRGARAGVLKLMRPRSGEAQPPLIWADATGRVPRLRVLEPGQAPAAGLHILPEHGARHDPSRPLQVTVRLQHKALPRAPDARLAVTATDLAGRRCTAMVALREDSATLPRTVQVPPQAFTPVPLSPGALRLASGGALVLRAELRQDGRPPARSAYHVIELAGPP